jgi:hypothetical protein
MLAVIHSRTFCFLVYCLRNETGIYKTKMLPVSLHGCEIWFLMLRDQYRLAVFEFKVMRTTFGAKRDEVTGGCEKLYNGKVHNFYPSPSIIRMIKSRRIRWTGHVARIGRK